MTDDPVRLSEPHGRLFFALQSAAHVLRKVADREIVASTKLTAAQAGVLYVVAAGAATRQGAIADLLGQNESAVTEMCARLRKDGYLARERDARDRRAFTLSVTADGLAELAKTKPGFERLDTIVDSALSEPEIAAATDLLLRLAGAFAEQR